MEFLPNVRVCMCVRALTHTPCQSLSPSGDDWLEEMLNRFFLEVEVSFGNTGKLHFDLAQILYMKIIIP